MKKLTRFAKRTNEGQAGLLAGLEGERDAEIDLGPMPGLRKIRTAEGRVLARGSARCFLGGLRGLCFGDEACAAGCSDVLADGCDSAEAEVVSGRCYGGDVCFDDRGLSSERAIFVACVCGDAGACAFIVDACSGGGA